MSQEEHDRLVDEVKWEMMVEGLQYRKLEYHRKRN